MTARALLVLAALPLVACTRHLIPGTQIEDTDDTRAILGVMKQYVSALEARDPEGVMALVSKDFRDNAGTSTPEDDLDYAALGSALKDRFARAENVRVELDVRDIAVKDDGAEAIYYYTLRYNLPGLTEKTQTASELKRMLLKRADGAWKIASGI